MHLLLYITIHYLLYLTISYYFLLFLTIFYYLLLSFSLCLCLGLPLSTSLFLSLCVSLTHILSVCICLYVYVCMSVYLFSGNLEIRDDGVMERILGIAPHERVPRRQIRIPRDLLNVVNAPHCVWPRSKFQRSTPHTTTIPTHDIPGPLQGSTARVPNCLPSRYKHGSRCIW